MKILFISTGDSKYGAPKSMLALMQILKENYGVEIVLLTKKYNSLNRYCDKNKIENHSFFYRDIMAGSNYDTWILNFAKHTLKFVQFVIGGCSQHLIHRTNIDFSSIDIVHSNTNRVDIGAFISKKYHIPHVWHLREMDEGVKRMFYYKKKWNKYMNENTNIFIAISQAVKCSWVNHGLDENLIRVIPNGVDSKPIVKKQKNNMSEKLRILAVGRIEKGKGQLDLIGALCKLDKCLQKKISVHFIGDFYQEYKAKMDKALNDSKCEAEISYKGYRNDVLLQLQNYDVGITCSPAEAFGRTTVEYMLAGLLTIVSDTGANTELIQNNVSGIVYKQGDIDDLSRILKEILFKKMDMYFIAQNGYNRAKNLYCVEENARHIYELYQGVNFDES